MIINPITLSFIIFGVIALSVVLYLIFKPKAGQPLPTSSPIPTTTPEVEAEKISQPSFNKPPDTYNYKIDRPLCTTHDCIIPTENKGYVTNIYTIGTITKTGLLTSLDFKAIVTISHGENISSYYLMIGSLPEPLSCNTSYCNGPQPFAKPLENNSPIQFTDTPQVYVKKDDLIQLILSNKISTAEFKIDNVNINLRIV